LTLLWNSEKRPDFIDVWVWRSARTHPVGRVDEGFVDLNHPVMAASPFTPDVGKRCWFSRYLGSFVGETVPRFQFAPPTQSCADVTAAAVWEDETWNIELSRPLKTRYRDDLDLSDISDVGIKMFVREPDSDDWFGGKGCVFLEDTPSKSEPDASRPTDGGGAP
jgi:hypothetical protein